MKNFYKMTPKVAARLLTKESLNGKRAFEMTQRLTMLFGGLGEEGTLDTLHALSMYTASIIRAGSAEDPGLVRQLLAWTYKDIKKGIFRRDGSVWKKHA